MFTTDTSHSLLDRLRSQEQVRDWELFCELYAPFIHRHLLARNVRPHDVDDQVQEILLRLTTALPNFHHNGHAGAFRKWLGEIVAQQAWRYHHQRKEMVSLDDSRASALLEADQGSGELESRWNEEHDRFIVDRMLIVIRREFTETTWQAFHLLTLEGLSPPQVAQRLGISANAAIIAKSRVMRRLRVVGKDLVDRF